MIRVVVDDLASFTADALVRPATTRLDPTAAALRRLETVGGEEFHNRIRLSRELAVGGRHDDVADERRGREERAQRRT